MKHRYLLPCVLATLSMMSGCKHSNYIPGGLTSGWLLYTPFDKSYTVLFPGVPKKETRTVPNPNGNLMLYRAFYTNRQKTRSYNAAVLRGKILSGNFNVEKMLDGARNGAVVKMNGSLIYEKKISLDGIPGREFSANLPDRFIMTERVYIRPKSNIVTIYQFSTLYYPESKDAKIDEAFFDSAVITQ